MALFSAASKAAVHLVEVEVEVEVLERPEEGVEEEEFWWRQRSHLSSVQAEAEEVEDPFWQQKILPLFQEGAEAEEEPLGPCVVFIA